MDYEVEWSPEALDDVDNIAAFIARDSGYYAGAVVGKIIEKSRTLNSSLSVGVLFLNWMMSRYANYWFINTV